jgi:metal-responsive CopG/Arc/MetJ family transcriptional regulator
VKTAISIPDDLFRAAERTAERLGLSRSELYRRAVAAFLQRHSDEAVTESLNAVYADQDSRVDPSLLRAQVASLEQAEW